MITNPGRIRAAFRHAASNLGDRKVGFRGQPRTTTHFSSRLAFAVFPTSSLRPLAPTFRTGHRAVSSFRHRRPGFRPGVRPAVGRLRNDPRNLAETLERIEADIVRVQRELEQNRHSLKVLGDDGREVHRLWSLETIGKLNTKIQNVEDLIRGVMSTYASITVRGYRVFNPYYVAIFAAACVAIGLVRRRIYTRVAEESAELGKELLEKNRRNVVATIERVARDPETLVALQVLLGQLLRSGATKAALLELLYATFEDPKLCADTGAFLVAGLDTPHAREQLAKQLAALVETTLQDEQLRYDAAEAVAAVAKQSTAHAVLPKRWLGRPGPPPQADASPAPPPPPPTPPPTPPQAPLPTPPTPPTPAEGNGIVGGAVPSAQRDEKFPPHPQGASRSAKPPSLALAASEGPESPESENEADLSSKCTLEKPKKHKNCDDSGKDPPPPGFSK